MCKCKRFILYLSLLRDHNLTQDKLSEPENTDKLPLSVLVIHFVLQYKQLFERNLENLNQWRGSCWFNWSRQLCFKSWL